MERVSQNEVEASETAAIMQVFEFPPRESRRMKVNFESRYGICLDLRWLDSTREFITQPFNVLNELFWKGKGEGTEDRERLVDISGFF